MDENNGRERLVSRRSDGSRSVPSPRSANPTTKPASGSNTSGGGGLLSRYGTGNLEPPQESPEAEDHGRDRENRAGRQGPLQAFGGQARRLGDNFRRAAMRNRTPQAGNWRASDFDPDTLEAWDRHGSVPFTLPRDPDMPDGIDDELYDDTYDAPPRRHRGNGGDYDPDGDWGADQYDDAVWETGTWDTGWASGYQPSLSEDGAAWDDDNDDDDESSQLPSYAGKATGYRERAPGRRGRYGQAMGTIAVLGSVGASLGRVDRLRLLLRRRPAAAALLAFFLLGLLLTASAPLLPLMRLGFDAADAYQRAQSLQALFADGSTSLLNTAKLQDAQTQVDSLSQDLYEINSVVSTLGAPLAVASPQLRDDRLLVRIGSDLSASADEGLQVARTILTPLQGGALATQGSASSITAADLSQAQGVLADATGRVQDALAAYTQLDPAALPSQLRPGTKLGGYLQLLPLAPQVVAELSTLMQGVSSLLGVGQPADYLVMALDRSELRPVGGFAGNYGILELDNGRQSTAHPFSLSDVYVLDQQYFQSQLPASPVQDCIGEGTQPPEYYWWWPYRNLGCQYGWGLRDSGLSPSFPIDAQTAMQIVEQTPNAVPNDASLQGVIAFTPVLIERLMSVTGNITLPQYGSDAVVTPKNLEYLIHKYQLVDNTGQADRKTFTHDLSIAMLAKIKTLHGSQLKTLFSIVEKSLKSKDLELYFANPNAELILQQLGLASDIQTGNGDGFYVVDTNDGGNKANAYVSEQQTDVVTLLPNGGALHQLQIAVTYNRAGLVFSSNTNDYFDMQRTYLPADATILGYSGFNAPYYDWDHRRLIARSRHRVPLPTVPATTSGIHDFVDPVTTSDVPGRTMVMGALTVNCGPYARERALQHNRLATHMPARPAHSQIPRTSTSSGILPMPSA